MLLIGAPARMTREFNALLDFLRADGKALPVLIMAHEQNAELTAFAQARAHSSLVLWANFSRIPGAIRALIPDADEHHEAPAAAPVKAGAHGPIRILFTCDEEIGHGIDHADEGFDVLQALAEDLCIGRSLRCQFRNPFPQPFQNGIPLPSLTDRDDFAHGFCLRFDAREAVT